MIVYVREANPQAVLHDIYAAPGDTNTPVIFEPPAALNGGALEVWIVATGALPDWGGCQVYMSADGTTFASEGAILRGGRQGTLTALLPSAADPDTTDTLSVDLTESTGQLLSGTQADADNAITLCWCDGELVAYETATLTAAYNYNLTYLRRGLYGTPIGSHASGARFARLDPTALVKFGFPASLIGQTIYLKLPSFNLVGNEAQDLATVTEYSYTLTGGGALLTNVAVRGSMSGAMLSAQPARWICATPVVFAAGFSGSAGVAEVAAAAPANFTIAINGTTVGTMSFAAGATAATFTSTAAGPFAWLAGQVLTATPPASPDASLAGVAWALGGTQGSGAATPVVEARFSQTGLTTANLTIGRWVCPNPVTFPAGLFGSQGAAAIAATGATTCSLQKNGVQFGTMHFAAAAAVATFTAAAATVFNPGDVLTVVAPATPDATLAGLAWTLLGTNNLAHPSAYVGGAFEAAPVGGVTVAEATFPGAFTVAQGMPGSVATAAVAATGSSVFAIEKDGVQVGTMTFAPGATVAGFAMAAPTSWGADRLTIVAPATPDTTLAGVAWAIAGTD